MMLVRSTNPPETVGVVPPEIGAAVVEILREFNTKVNELEAEVGRLNDVIARLDHELAEWHSRFIDYDRAVSDFLRDWDEWPCQHCASPPLIRDGDRYVRAHLPDCTWRPLWDLSQSAGPAGLTVGAKGPRPSTQHAPEPDATAPGTEPRVGG